MLLRMMNNDFKRKKGIHLVLFIFILLSALLVSSGTNMIIELTRSINHLFQEAKTPHFVQLHSGELSQEEVDRIGSWSEANGKVVQHQVVEMVNVDGSNMFMGAESEKSSVMDIDMVVQNEAFDYLLNLDSQIIHVQDGEVAVPVYYKQARDLKIGDTIRIDDGKFKRSYRIVDFVRDAQMNPSIIHSKRFVLSQADYDSLKSNAGEAEYLIEFRLDSLASVGAFTSEYQASGLPKKGPAVDYSLFKTLNALTDGVVAAVVILVSLILNVIAILCIRFTMLATIEEDYREISVLKAIGISQKHIKRLYLSKYMLMAAGASIAGYAVSFLVNRLFTANIMLYIGEAPKTPMHYAVPLAAVAVIFVMVVFFCSLVLRRFKRISAVEGLRTGSMGDTKVRANRLSLVRNRLLPVPVFLGLKDVMQRLSMFRLLLFVFIVSSFIIIVPVNFLNTIQSPSFISYMGVGQSDIRIDLRYSDDVESRYRELVDRVSHDPDIAQYSPLVTSQFKVLNEEGAYDNLSVETGDFSIFPLDYLNGSAPSKDDEIALSYVNSKEMGKHTGDTLIMTVGSRDKTMKVSGVYQDVTNGGRTAKAVLPYNGDEVLWYVVSMDVKDEGAIPDKIAEYEKAFYPAKVTDLKGYLNQTLGGTISQLKLVTVLSLVIAVCVSILITSLFLRMLVVKDNAQIAVLRSLGFALSRIKIKYVTMALLVLFVGIAAGTILSNTAGQLLIGGIMSFFGASQITFIVNPVYAYVLCPALLAAVVAVTTLVSINSIKQSNISKTIVE
ncbi:ABC transporter permease [Paenibacillus kobensis]|uniref:ABC transporter permease n=1 Tax=Paenibacillus kobensis TaxID=59841 RepID=UPI000FDB2DC4|nr:FtsX-like permease family protein [Paenibacillus kobensis]